MNAETLLALFGGLGLFLLGMKMMSESIEKAAGAKLREILEFFTKNTFTGMLVGLLFTAIIQSSSACTVMVVSFVNSGLMTLYQAAGVIFGANIGTTVTAQLVSFDLSKYAPVFLLSGVLVVMFSKKQTTFVKLASILMGFGVLFTGLDAMSSSMSGLKTDPRVIDLFSSLTSPLLAILVGTVLTAIIQSSSVTVSILLLMCKEGLLGLPIAMFILLGCNIGACTSALLASATGTKDAKRAAMIHFLFNVIGTILIFIILQFAMDPVLVGLDKISSNDPGRVVANAHTIFKIAQTIMIFPFAKYLVKLTYVVVPGEEEKIGYRESYQLKFIGAKAFFNPATAVVNAINELERMASLASENLNRAMNCLITLDEEDMQEVYAVEDNINYLNTEITHYLVKINQMTLPIEDQKSLGSLFHAANDIERIGDYARGIADSAVKCKEGNITFTKSAQRELGDMLNMVNTLLLFAIEMFYTNSEEHLQDIINLEEGVDEKELELQKNHVQRLADGVCTPEAGMLFADVTGGLERIADHATNLAFSVLSEETLAVAKAGSKDRSSHSA
ncbi:MAG: Na/Pi cotransporter family protein [Lachnospiraceae bacterium]|nr:Na/Pi cotransporter family protein [Lachnospiraceae bacterium]